jgi:hypothetical protein
MQDFEQNPLDMRLAMNAAVALNQLADYFWQTFNSTDPARVYGAPSVRGLRDALVARCPEFAVVRDVAEAHKHMKLDRGARVLTRADQTAQGSTAFGEAGYGTGPWGGGPSVVVELDTRERVHFSHAARVVLEQWKAMLR